MIFCSERHLSHEAATAILDIFATYDVEFEYMDPAVVFRTELSSHTDFQVQDTFGNIIPGAVQLPCPWCKSNKHVVTSGFNRQHCRTVHTMTGVTAIISTLYSCLNTSCPGPPTARCRGKHQQEADADISSSMKETPDKESEDTAKKRTKLRVEHQFSPHLDEYLRCLPQTVSRRFRSVIPSSKGGYSVTLATYLLQNYAQPLSHQEAVLVSLAADRESQGRARYEAFIEKMSCSVERASFHAWKTRLAGGCLAYPSQKKLRTIFDSAYERIKPILQEDIQSKSVGYCLSGDGTHRLGGRSIGDATAIHFVMNERSYVVAFGAARSDSLPPMIPLYMGLRARAEREGKLNDIQAVYLDTCCENRNDISETPLAYIFPSVDHVSGDGYHLDNRITRTTHPHHESHRSLSEDVGAAIRAPHLDDHKVVVDALMRAAAEKGKPIHRMAAEAQAWAPAYRSSIRTIAHPGPVIAARLEAVWKK